MIQYQYQEYNFRIFLQMNSKVEQFQAITQDFNLERREIQKFLKWSKGDIQQALNYYYNHLEKGKIKYKSQPAKKSEQIHEKQNEIKIEFSQDEASGSNVFNVLRRGSIKQQKTQQFIDKIRKIYRLPIKGRSQKDLIASSQQKMEHEIPDQFFNADCLSEAFNPENLPQQTFSLKHPEIQEKLSIKEDIQFIQEGQHNSDISQQQDANSIQEQMHTESLPKPIQKKEQKGLEQQNLHQKILRTQYNFCEKLEEDQIYVGQYIVDAFCSQRKKLDMLHVGDPIKIVQYIEEMKVKKKKNFGKKNDRIMHMRIYFDDRQIGRVQDYEVRVIMPLIDEKLIRTQFQIFDFPLFSDLFKPMKLKARVYFTKKLITEPIVESFQPQEKDKEKVHQISALLSKLNLPILVEPLVKGKSKYTRNNQKKKTKESIDLFNYRKYEEQQVNRKEEMLKKQQQLQIKARNDPNFSMKQKSLADMITKSRSSSGKIETQNTKAQTSIYSEDSGKVQKKVIQIDKPSEKNKFSELIDLHDEDVEPYQPPDTFVSTLYDYQSLALGWMLKREGFKDDKEDHEEIHPLWSEYQIPSCPKYRLFFNELTGQLCVKRPISKIQCKGGILADQMGLGKTVMMTALIVSHPPQKSKSKEPKAGTLVIVPLTLLSQWQSEIYRHTKNTKVCLYYSTSRKAIEKSLGTYDVVISTYGTASHEFSQGCHIKKSGLFRFKWHRIILDQAHYIKGRIIQTSKAMYELNGRHKWCLTGTPIQNTISDIFSLLHFIKYTPWSQHACWSRFIEKPLEQGQKSIYEVLKTILKRVFLRRTKNSQGSDGKPIIQLPPRISKVQILTMNKKQREFYDSIYQASRMQIDSLIDKGILQAKYMQVLEMLIRLRQICCHPILFKSVSKFTKNSEEFKAQIMKMIQKWEQRANKNNSQSQDQYYEPLINGENEEERIRTSSTNIQFSEEYFRTIIEKIETGSLDICIICLNDPDDPVITPCMHIYCKPCLIRQIQQQGFCPVCRRKIIKQDFLHLPRQDRLNINQRNDIFASTKMVALLEHLTALQKDDKVVIFSQFLGFMDLLEKQIEKAKLKYVRMQGSNSHKQRTKIVKKFQEDKNVQIFLVSLKTAGVGLNLVAANKVFLMDPWWNPAVEEQAIERVHRIGQNRAVTIIRFIMDKTIEARMLQLNTQKKILSQNVLSQNSSEQNPVRKMEKLKYLMQNY